MTRELTLEELLSISETKSVQSVVNIASGNSTQIGGDIPIGKQRNIWFLKIESVNGAQQNYEILRGDTTEDREELDRGQTPETATPITLPIIIGGDPRKPFMVCKPTEGTTREGYRLGVAHQTSAINFTVSYFDSPIP